MSKRIKIFPARYGKKDTYCSIIGAPEGEIFEGSVSVSYINKLQGGAVYPVFVAVFKWYKGNNEYALPAMKALRPNLKKMSLEKREAYTSQDWQYEIWACKNAYADRDIVRYINAALEMTFERNDWGMLVLKGDKNE